MPRRFHKLLAAFSTFALISSCGMLPSTNTTAQMTERLNDSVENVESDETEVPTVMTVEEQLKALQRIIDVAPTATILNKSDIISVSVFGEPELTFSAVEIRPDGIISLPLIGDVMAAGKTTQDLKIVLEDLYSEFLVDPSVTVVTINLKSQSYTVQGEVNRPGRYQIDRDISISEAISIAGGLKKGAFKATTIEVADLQHASIIRDGEILPVDFVALLRDRDSRFDITVKSGDKIVIPSGLREEIYVLGEVNNPTLLPYKENMQISRSLALAAGTNQFANLRNIHVIRGSLSNPQILKFDFVGVLKGQGSEIALKPGDIVYVPKTGISSWTQIVNQIAPTLSIMNSGILLSETIRRR